MVRLASTSAGLAFSSRACSRMTSARVPKSRASKSSADMEILLKRAFETGQPLNLPQAGPKALRSRGAAGRVEARRRLWRSLPFHERGQPRHSWGNAMSDGMISFGAKLRQHAQRQPEAPAVTCDDQTITYGELHRRSN